MDYRPLNLGDRDRFNAALRVAPWMKDYVNSELVFENLIPWTASDMIEIYWSERFGLVRCNRLGAKSYFPPIASDEATFREAIAAVLQEEPAPLFIGLTEAMLAFLPKRGVVLYDDILAEYVYSARELAELKGGKFHRRRNLYSQFVKAYEHRIVSYDPSHRDAVVDLFNRYLAQGGDEADFHPLLAALDASAVLPIDGLLLYVKDTLCALSVSTVTPYGKGVVLFEKADVEYVGAYTAIAKYAASGPLAATLEVSRQEDLGLPHLRKAKLANQPLRKEPKYAWIADRTIAGMHALYAACFPEDSRPYVDYVFLNQAVRDRIQTVETNGDVVAGLLALPRRIRFQNRSWACDTIVGAAVRPEDRGKGLLKDVLAKAVADASRREIPFVTLSPTNEAVYRSSGFLTYAYVQPLGTHFPEVAVELEATVNVATLMRLFAIATANKTLWHVRDEARWYDWMNALWQDRFVVSLIKRDGAPIGYVAHRDFEIEELLLIEDVLPVCPGFDFAKAQIPSETGTPAHMIRIANLASFWSDLVVDPALHETVRVRFVDPLVFHNNKAYELTAKDGKIEARETDREDHVLTVEELAGIAFLGHPHPVFSRWFPPVSRLTYDRY